MKFANTPSVWEVDGEVMVMKLLQPLSELLPHRSLAVCDGGILLMLTQAKVKRSFRSGELKVSFAEDGKEFCVPIQQIDYLLDSNGEAIFE